MQKIKELLTRLAKRKIFWFGLIILVIIIVLIVRASGGSKVQYVEEKVQKGTLRQTVSETGTIKAAEAINLNFKGLGTLREIAVNEGEEVIANQVLARLDAGALEIQVRQADANLQIAQASLNRLLAGASTEDIKVTEEQVNNAKIAADNAQKNHDALLLKLEADIKNYQEAIDNAKNSLNDTQESTSQNIVYGRDNLLNSLTSALAMVDHGLDVIQLVFDDQNLKQGFSVENFQYKVSAKNYQELALAKLPQASDLLNKAKISLNENDIKQAVNYALEALDAAKKALDNTFNALSASTTTYYFNDAQLAAYKSNVKIEQSSVDGAISSVNNTSQSWQSAQLANQSGVNTTQGNYDSAVKNLATALANKTLQISTSQSTVDSAVGNYNLAKAQFDYKIAKPRSADISYYDGQVNQAKAAMDLALSNLDDYTIYAPIDGVITFINYKIGEQIGSSGTGGLAKSVIAMLGKGQFQIEVDVPESDIVKVAVGNKAKITLDAYGNDVEFLGQVISIDVAETIIQDVVYYRVTVQLDPTDKEIKSGMTANVDLITAQKENVLIIPNRAIKEDSQAKKYVEILSFGNPKRFDVTTGLRGDEGTEVLSGLKEGQAIIIYKK